MMRRIAVLGAVAILSAAAGLAGPATQPAGQDDKPKPLRVLILTGRNNHDWRRTTPVLKKLFDDSDRFTADVTAEPEKMTAEMLAKYDAIVSNWCAFPKLTERSWGEAAEKAFLDFVRGGKGFALFHAASATFHNWPEFQKLAGATWGKGTHHGPNGERIVVSAAAPEHPIAKGLTDFLAADELWRSVVAQKDIEVVCRARPVAANAKPVAPGGEPVVICTKLGKGRGFYLTLGHDVKAMQNVGWRTLMLRGTEWCATGAVTIPVPADWPAAAPADKAAEGEAK